MIIHIGNFLFRYRNGLFPVVYPLLFFQGSAVFSDFRVAALIGFLVASTGQALRAVTFGLEYIIRGGRNRQVYADQLVRAGVYACCRNPLYVGNGLILLGLGFAANSWLFLGVAFPFFVFAYWAIIVAEENYLRGKFGQEFDDYCQRVHGILPTIPAQGLHSGPLRFNWRRLITAEYGSAYAWSAALLVVTFKNAWFAGGFRLNRPLIEVVLAGLAVATLGYAVARWLMKSGLLPTMRRSAG